MLSADSVGKRFGTTVVLRAASLSLSTGITFLVGRNGAGKTTLVRILMGLIEADSGLVRFRDQYVERPRWSSMARQGLTYLPAGGFLPLKSRMATAFNAVSQSGEACRHVVERSRLGDLMGRRIAEVSTGERKRAELAWIALRQPGVLIADEPLRDLSPIDRGYAMTQMRDLANAGCAILVTGHEVENLLADADSVLWLRDGTVIDLGSPEEALENPAFLVEYLGR